jgi:hypothetical protein
MNFLRKTTNASMAGAVRAEKRTSTSPVSVRPATGRRKAAGVVIMLAELIGILIVVAFWYLLYISTL